ncbi:hypothetical protein EAF00_004888 [Botryotinia globosa]|nr:hypothetical protein EAF00_004888 [Botryotinia globosa]
MLRRPYLDQDRSAPKRQRQIRRRLPPRASQTCHACASSKTRCDNNLTCARCRKRNIPCLRDAHLSDVEDETRDPATVQRAAFGDEIDASLSGTFQDSFDGAFSNQNSTAASNGALDSRAPRSPTQNITDGLPELPLVPATWGLDASFDLLNQDGPEGRLEWVDGDARTYNVQQAISQSIGQWTPKSGHYRAHAQKDMVSKDLLSLKIDFSGQWDPSISGEPLVPRTRDKIIALAVGSCDLIGYIHVLTFSKSESRVETITAMIITRGGLEIWLWTRGNTQLLIVQSGEEREYSLTRDLQYLQAFCLSLSDGLWSGSNHKMKLAKSVSGVLISVSQARVKNESCELLTENA